MKAYLIALEIEPVELGRIYFRLPLHCTVLHWFLADAPAEALLARVEPVLAAATPIRLVSGRPDHFGPSRGPQIVAVNRLQPSIQLTDLHRRLYQDVTPLNPRHTEPYVLDNFIFHVTKQGSRRFEQGETFLATTAYVVEALDPVLIARKQIVAKLDLEGNL